MKIYIDTREQFPWDFSFYGFEQEYLKLETGDYFVEEIPDLVFERKRSTGEISLNLGKKWKQFHAEMQRMKDFKKSYLICEFPIEYLDTFPENSGIPKSQMPYVRMNANFMKSRLFQNCKKYNIEVLFFNSAEDAQNKVVEIINEFK